MDLSTLPAEEAARRKAQRERQQLALKLQAEGKKYNPKRARRKSHKPKRPVQVRRAGGGWDPMRFVGPAAERMRPPAL